MSNQSDLSVRRREAAASIQWPERTVALLNPDPVVRRKLRTALVCFGVVAFLAFGVFGRDGLISDISRHRAQTALRAKMELAMTSGDKGAGTWLALHYPRDYPELLRVEAKAGDPTAMFIVGTSLFRGFDPNYPFRPVPMTSAAKSEGADLIRKAAAAGNQEALAMAMRVDLGR